MSDTSSFDRVRELHGKAQGRNARRRYEPQGQTPQIGEIFAFPKTADHPVLWTVVDRDDQYVQAVATDLDPLLGMTDIATAAEGEGAAWSLRCAYAIRLAVEAFASSKRIAVLDAVTVDEVRQKRREIEQGTAAAADLERDDGDPEYEDWIEEVARARATLLEKWSSGVPVASVGERGSTLRPTTSRRVYALAASILLAVALGWMGGMMAQRASEGPDVNVAFKLLPASGALRGDVVTVEMPPEARSVLLIIETDEDYPLYRLEMDPAATEAPVWTSNELRKVGQTELTVSLPRRLFPDGEYRLRVFGLRDGQTELLAEYVLRLQSL